MPMQIRRTPTPNAAPTGLAQGQLSVEMASTPPKLWVGVPAAIDPTGRRSLTEFLPLTGGTLNPNGLTIINPGGAAGLAMIGLDGNFLTCYRGTTTAAAGLRWQLQIPNGAAEGVGNTGSDFAVARFSNAGAYIDAPLVITRSTGAVQFTGTLTMPGGGRISGASGAVTLTAGDGVATTMVGNGGYWVAAVNTGARIAYGDNYFALQSMPGSGEIWSVKDNPMRGQFTNGYMVCGNVNAGWGGGALRIHTMGGASQNVAAVFQWGGQPTTTGWGGGAGVGSITCTSTATAYNVSSDARLKEDDSAFTEGRAILDALSVRRYHWRSDGSEGIGFMAQDVHAAYPAAVTEGRGEPGEAFFHPWSIDYSKYVPLLIEALQAAHRRIDQLEARHG